MINNIRTLIILLFIPFFLNAQTKEEKDSVFQEKKMEWFKDAKLGIFIHWGIYSVNGISESWSFYNNYISHEDYLKQLKGFTAKKYDPAYWAKLIAESGAKYVVITSKHHDGFALWDTKYGNLNAVKSSAAKRDVLTPFIKELRKNHLKVGIYFSLPDWSSDLYTDFTRDKKRYKIADDPKRWEKFKKYFQGQLKELATKYNPDIWWFDGDWEHNDKEWDVPKVKGILLKNNPYTIINSRLRQKGDYDTPEQGLPIVKPKSKYWELCMTMNESWGYQPADTHYKSSQQIIDIFVDCISKGGNLLLDIGPKADGTIPEEQVKILKDLGRWTKKHSKAIYGTEAGIPYEYYYGPTALSKDSTTLYLYVRDIPKDGKVPIRGIKNKINRIFVVGNGAILNYEVFSKVYWSAYPGLTYIDLPKQVIDENYTVIAVMLEGKIDLYDKVHGAIESN
ncbi:MAG: alpha-L-fucosidase [Flavobacteriia bacterium]|nr:MAG: alpha-L-fucosidase [Flavobacteriia bacterium]